MLVVRPAISGELIIVNRQVTQNIGKNELRSIFTMRRRSWTDGSPIHVFVLDDDQPVHKSFCKNILSIFPHRLRKKWNRLVFTGTGQAPTEVVSEQDMLNKVATTPGAIGYLSEENINAEVKAISFERTSTDDQ